MKLCLISIFICFTYQGFTQSENTLSSEYLHGFNHINDQSFENYIHNIAEEAKIIGLGEVSHYTKECYEFKSKIIELLWDKGYKSLILEVDFGQALKWNDYATKGQGNLDSLIATSGWFTYRTEEFKSLLQSIRQHNMNNANNDENPFQIFGMEMTSVQDNIQWIQAFLKNVLEKEAPVYSLLFQDRKMIAFEEFTHEESLDYWRLYNELDLYFEANKVQLIELNGHTNYTIGLQIIEIFRQFASFISQDDFSLKVELRDQFSSRNVAWCMNQIRETDKAIIWAHNGHITKKSVLFNYDVLGHYLNKWYGNSYYSIGFTFNEGDFGAFSDSGFKKWTVPAINEESINRFFQSSKSLFAYYDIRNHLENDKNLNHYIYQKQLIRRDISEFQRENAESLMSINLSESYDALIYIEKTNFPTSIDWIQLSN